MATLSFDVWRNNNKTSKNVRNKSGLDGFDDSEQTELVTSYQDWCVLQSAASIW